MSDVWVRSAIGLFEFRDGTPWWEVPIPRRFHRCRAQCREVNVPTPREWCACGATREVGANPWRGKNSRSRL